MHSWIKMLVKREAEMCQTQAGRPRRGWPANKYQLQTDTTIHRHLEKIRSVHEKVVAKWMKSQAGRPRGGQPAPLCSVSSSSSHGSYVNRPSCIHPTPRPNTDL